METKNLGERNGYQLMSLASRIKAIHHALTAEELAELLKVLEVDDPPSRQAGNHSLLPGGFVRSLRSRQYQQMARGHGSKEDVQALSGAE